MTIRFPLYTILLLCIMTTFLAVSCNGGDPVTPSGAAGFSTDPATDGDSLDVAELPTGGEYIPSPSRSEEIEPYAPDEVLVSLHEDMIPHGTNGIATAVGSFLANNGLRLEKKLDAIWDTIYVLKILDGTPVPEKIEELEALPFVDHAEPNISFQPCDVFYTPNDPLWEFTDDMDEDPRTHPRDQFAPAKVGATALWAESVVGQDIVVCVIDSGVQVLHEDLQNTMWINEDEIPDNGIDDDYNGYIDDIYGWDTYEGDNDITEYNNDNYYHGTSCSGIIAAEMDNELGCVGIAPGARIMGVKIEFGYSFLSVVLEAVIYARNNGADIISMSFSSTSDSYFMENSMNQAWNDGLLLAAAASNDDNTDLHWPAAYDTVVCVGASVPFGKAWNYEPIDEVRVSKAGGYGWGSNYGPQLNVMGFGEFIITTHGNNNTNYYKGNNNDFFRGTSAATPVVAGVMALVKCMNPTETNQQLRDRIEYLSDDIGEPGFDIQTGWGRVNAIRACYGNDRYEAEEDENGFVDLTPHDNSVTDSIHAVEAPWHDPEDFYKITATQTGSLNFYLDIFTWGEDIEMQVFSDPSMSPESFLDQSVGENHAINSFEVCGVSCVEGQTYYVRLFPGNLGDSSSYTLTAEYVDPALHLEIQTYDPGFTHLGRTNVLLGHLDFSSGQTTRITRLSFNLAGSMPGEKLVKLALYEDSYVNDNWDSLDRKVAEASINGTNRAIFSGIYEEISQATGVTRYFLVADLSGIIVDAQYTLSLSSYKDVVTAEGIEIAYDEFPFTFGPYYVGVDIEAPLWTGPPGVRATLPRYKGAGLFWNDAWDPRTPPVDYNVYWTDELPFEFSTANVEERVEFWDGGDYDHRWVLLGLENDQEYFVAVRAIDQAGNEEDNEIVMSVIPDDTPDPTWPQTVGTLDVDGNNAREVKADPAHQRVFLADQNLGLMIIDCSDPVNPELINTVEAAGAKGVDYDGTYAYVAYGDGLMIVDPDGAEGPEVVSTVPFSDTTRVIANGNWVYVSKNGTDLLPIDITDPENPVAYPTVASGNVSYALYIDGGYLYNSTFDHVRTLDLIDPSAPSEVANFCAAQAHDTVTVGNLLYVAIWNDRRAYVFDNTDPTAPVQLGSWRSNSGYRGSAVVWFHDYLYFSTQSWGVEVLDVTDPENISEVGQMSTRGPDGMDTDGSFIYAAENEHGLRIIL